MVANIICCLVGVFVDFFTYALVYASKDDREE